MADETPEEESAETAVEEAQAAVVDEFRDGLAAEIASEMGDGVVETFVKPGDDVWVRVTRESWVATAEALKNSMGFGFFGFLSAIDWMPSPFGRDMDSQVDLTLNPPEEESEAEPIETGYAGGDTRFQVFMRVNDICLLYTSDAADE